ncbi:hypothetical protein M9H77_18095 [Catharanthus roseus]|uniref:Uncharacterized protein n=1 Tax=Catharanthus roseus TaxID=4058 RepID=A0ACC0B6P1_CATRO|nr:hypothetical protein M9H77_18095 [Catharanthus roseus]
MAHTEESLIVKSIGDFIFKQGLVDTQYCVERHKVNISFDTILDGDSAHNKGDITTNMGRAYSKTTTRYLDNKEYKATVNCIQLNCDEVESYLMKYTMEIEDIEKPVNARNDECLKSLSWDPSKCVKSCHGYFGNGFSFHIQERGSSSLTYNYGLRGELGSVDICGRSSIVDEDENNEDEEEVEWESDEEEEEEEFESESDSET